MAVDVVKGILHGKSVLVMEDEYFIADDIARALTALGAQVVGPFGHVDQGLQRLRARPPIDLAILDINLNGTKVFEIADELTVKDIPFIFATGYGSGALPEQYASVPRWEKPFDIASLARALAWLSNDPSQATQLG
jgi:CheY-like chemotaxis protein